MFKPVNRHILIEKVDNTESEQDSLIVLPETYKPQEERYILVSVAGSASDVRFDLSQGDQLVIDSSMIEEISIGGTIYNVILDNYVMGIVA